MQNSKYISVVAYLFMFAAMASVPSVVRADVIVESAVTRVGIEQGRQWNGSVSLVNTSDETVRLAVEVVNLERSGEGNPIPVIGESDDNRVHSLAGWVRTTDEVVIAPRSRVRVPLVIDIPDTAAPGAHLAALLFRTSVVTDGTISVTAATAAALEVRVTGDGVPELLLESFGTGRRFFMKGPIQAYASFVNRGDADVLLSGRLEVVSLTGVVREGIEIATQGTSVRLRPGSTERTELRAALGPGMFKVHVVADSGAKNYDESVVFFIVPWPLLAALAAGLSILLIFSRFGARILIFRKKA